MSVELAPLVPLLTDVSMSDTSTPSPRGSNSGGVGSYIPSTASLIKSAWTCMKEGREGDRKRERWTERREGEREGWRERERERERYIVG